jgi:hypothetical protein
MFAKILKIRKRSTLTSNGGKITKHIEKLNGESNISSLFAEICEISHFRENGKRCLFSNPQVGYLNICVFANVT